MAEERQYLEEYESRLREYIDKALLLSGELMSSETNRHESTTAIIDNEICDDDEEELIRKMNEKELSDMQQQERDEIIQFTSIPVPSLPPLPPVPPPPPKPIHKHLYLTLLKFSGRSNRDYHVNLCEILMNHHFKADFSLIIFIRFLYQSNDPDIIAHALYVMGEFSFWPTSNHLHGHMPELEQVTRSGTCRLPRRVCVTEKDARLLLVYLEGHCHENFNGVYEVLSTTYLPYTLCALFNLYDFADDVSVKDKAHQLINRIICQLTLVTNRSGICNLTASARQYPHSRLYNFGHTINQLIYLLTGVSVDSFRPTAILDFLLTTTWRPPLEAIQNFMLPDRYVLRGQETSELKQGDPGGGEGGEVVRQGYWRAKERMNHKTREIRDIYQSQRINKSQVTPFFWSAGLITHPQYIEDTLQYKKKYRLDGNPGLSNLTYVPKMVGKKLMKETKHFSKGQNYTNIYLNTFKSPTRRVIMTSFDEYNVGLQAYQQLSWMVNFDGVGVWSQSGKHFAPNTTNVYGPAVTQNQNILLAVYCVHHSLFTDGSINLFWPSKYFIERRYSADETQLLDETQTLEYPPSWWFGERNNCYIGVYCNKPTKETTARTSDAESQYSRDEEQYIIPRRITTHHKVYWLVVVGDHLMYSSLDQFCFYCWHIDKHDEVTNRNYHVVVSPPNMGPLEITVDATTADTLRI